MPIKWEHQQRLKFYLALRKSGQNSGRPSVDNAKGSNGEQIEKNKQSGKKGIYLLGWKPEHAPEDGSVFSRMRSERIKKNFCE